MFQPLVFALKLAKVGLSIFGGPPSGARPAPSTTPRSKPEPPSAATPRSEVTPPAQSAKVAAAEEPARTAARFVPPPALAAALAKAYESTLAALDPKVTENEACESYDKKAAEDAEALQGAYTAAATELPEGSRDAYGAIVERVQQAQLQIMAFAINRKNRGKADAAETEAERRDRDEFRREVGPLYKALVAAN